jgi:hypothetical protein
MRKNMSSIKFVLAVSLLVFSGQTMALFMPEGFQIKDETTINEGGC